MNFIKKHMGDIVGVAGVVFISIGVLFYSFVIGMITTGVLLLGVAYLINKNGGD